MDRSCVEAFGYLGGAHLVHAGRRVPLAGFEAISLHYWRGGRVMSSSSGDVSGRRPVADHLSAVFKNISCCSLSDALDRLGLVGQVHGILPVWPGCPKCAGPAMTLKLSSEPGDSVATGTIDAIEACRPGDVLVLDFDGRVDLNSWGGITTYAAMYHGLAGCRL